MALHPDKRNKQRLAVLVPTHDMCPATFAFDLANMIGYTIAAIGDKFDVGLYYVAGTYIHKARQELLEKAISDGINYVVWVDSDMRFPKDAILQLLARDEDVVGINYSTRGIPPRFVGIKKTTSLDENGELVAGELCETNADSTGLEEVEAMGFGLVLMKSTALADLDPSDPWFFYEWNFDTGKLHVGEDVWFCKLLRDNGIKIHIDHDLSKQCRHTGQMEYRVEHAEAIAQARKEEQENGDTDVLGSDNGSQ